jgi:hypothetical protein
MGQVEKIDRMNASMAGIYAALFNIDQIFASTPQALRDAASWDRAIAKHNTQFYGGALR